MKHLITFLSLIILLSCSKESVDNRPAIQLSSSVSSAAMTVEMNHQWFTTKTGERIPLSFNCDTVYEDHSWVDIPTEPPTGNDEDRPVLFLGSSTIDHLNLPRYFPVSDYNVQKIGLPGRKWSDIYYYLNAHDTIISLRHPKQVVLYSGDNDIVQGVPLVTKYINGKKVIGMQNWFQTLCKKIWELDNSIIITFMYVKPSNPIKDVKYGTETGFQVASYFNRNMNNWLRTYHADHSTPSADTWSPNLRYNQLIAENYINNGIDNVHWSTLGYDRNMKNVIPLILKR